MAARSRQHAALGLAIRELRRTTGISQEAFAASCGLHRTYIGGIERGERNLSLRVVERLAAAIDVEPLTLLTPAEDEPDLS
jgi:transcriptional regulator with XRE-family HTH domain